MRPIDYRNDTWANVQSHVVGLRLQVWSAFRRHGPGTTRAIADKSGIDILTLRPRATELYQLGFLALVEDPGGNESGPLGKRRDARSSREGSGEQCGGIASEGIYTALSREEAERIFFAKRRDAIGFQPELKL